MVAHPYLVGAGGGGFEIHEFEYVGTTGLAELDALGHVVVFLVGVILHPSRNRGPRQPVGCRCYALPSPLVWKSPR